MLSEVTYDPVKHSKMELFCIERKQWKKLATYSYKFSVRDEYTKLVW